MPKKLDLSPEEMLERRREQWRRYAEKKRASRTPEEKRAAALATLATYHAKKDDPLWLANFRANSTKDPIRQKAYDRERNARQEVQARRRELQRARYDRLKDDPEFRAKAREQGRKQHAKNPERTLANVRLYQTRKMRASPPWLTTEHKKQMLAFYQQARKLTKETGVPHHVDHIEPLRGKDACGLHVPWNLQVLVGAKNLSKGNRRQTADDDHPDRARAA